MPTFTEEEVLQFLQTQAEKGESTRAKHLYYLLPKSVEYLRKINRLKRKDKRYHAKLLKKRFRELIESLNQSNLITIQEEAKARYLLVTDSEIASLEPTDFSILREKESIPAQNATKSLKSTLKIAFLIVALIFWTFYWSLFVLFLESNYLFPITVLFEHYPWLVLYLPGFSTLFTVGSVAVIYAINRSVSKKRNKKKLGAVKGESKLRLILRKVKHWFSNLSLKRSKKKNKPPKARVPAKSKKNPLRSIKKNFFWIPLLGAPSYYFTYLLALSIHTLLYRGYYMLPLDYPLPIEYVYQAFPLMELTSHIIGIASSAVLTSVIAHYYNRFKEANL